MADAQPLESRPCLLRILPGLALCLAVTAAAQLLAMAEHRLFGAVWLEGLVLAIMVGAALRTCWAPGERFRPGIAFSARLLLEIAVMLLGASVSATAVLAAGPALLGGIAAVVVAAIACAYGIGRLFGLSRRMATLVACVTSSSARPPPWPRSPPSPARTRHAPATAMIWPC